MRLTVNKLGLVRVMILKPGVEMHMVGQVAGFEPAKAQELINRGFAQEWSDEDVANDADMQEDLAARTEQRSAARNPGFGNPATQTGHNVSNLERQGGLVDSNVGLVRTDAGVSTSAVGDMSGGNSARVSQTGGAGSGSGTEPREGDITVSGANGDVVIPANWENIHHAKIMKLGRDISGKDDLNTEEAKAVISGAVKEQSEAAAGDEE